MEGFTNAFVLERVSASTIPFAIDDPMETPSNVWAATMKGWLNDARLNGWIARRKPLLQPRHKEARLQWAKQRKDWTSGDME